MSFNLDHTKPAHEVLFSRKISDTCHPLFMGKNVAVNFKNTLN